VPGGFSPRTPLFHVPDTPRAHHTRELPTGLRPAGGKPPPGPPSCRSCSPRPGRGEASPRTPLVPDPPPPHHDQFQNTLSRIAKNRHHKFFYNFAGGRKHHPRGRDKILKKFCGAIFPLHREMCAARRRVRYINVPTCFGRNCPLFFLKLGEKKHPPSSFSLFFFPKIHTLMYGTITQYTYVRTRAGC